jgi:aromatic ring-opening dioxygenase catalytic subunit (LigB family)
MASKGEFNTIRKKRVLIVAGLTPVHWLSHGSTMMLGEESESATYWKQAGDEALANGIKGVIMMVSENTPSSS